MPGIVEVSRVSEYQRNRIQKTRMETPFMIADHAITNTPVMHRLGLVRSNGTFTTSDKRKRVGACSYGVTTNLTATSLAGTTRRIYK
jgi:hypothetical protein